MGLYPEKILGGSRVAPLTEGFGLGVRANPSKWPCAGTARSIGPPPPLNPACSQGVLHLENIQACRMLVSMGGYPGSQTQVGGGGGVMVTHTGPGPPLVARCK